MNTPSATPGWSPDSGVPLQAKLKEDLKLALRTRHPGARLFAVFEPRSATASRKFHQDVYPEAFAAADVVLLARVARDLPPDERLDVARLAAELLQRGTDARHFDTVDAIVDELARRTRAGDVVAVLSNGTFGGIHAKLLSALSAAGP